MFMPDKTQTYYYKLCGLWRYNTSISRDIINASGCSGILFGHPVYKFSCSTTLCNTVNSYQTHSIDLRNTDTVILSLNIIQKFVKYFYLSE